MTRASRKILDRARSSAWRRVGMPSPWNEKPRDSDADTTGKNVTTDAPADKGTGRSDEERANVTDDSTTN